jgi:hypothetical protein
MDERIGRNPSSLGVPQPHDPHRQFSNDSTPTCRRLARVGGADGVGVGADGGEDDDRLAILLLPYQYYTIVLPVLHVTVTQLRPLFAHSGQIFDSFDRKSKS